MTFHKHAYARLVLLLTLVFSMLASAPAEARAHRTAHRARKAHHLTSAHGRKHIRKHHRKHRHHYRGRRSRNHVRHAGRYLAAARRLKLGVGDVQVGKASWYGARYHGRTTSSGEIFNKEELTAAHLSLPFGTRVRVRNLVNDSTVIVRITDRGPFGRGRVVDVSEAAARELGIVEQGVCRVALEVLPEELPAPCFDEDDLLQLTPIALEQPQDRYYFLLAGAYQDLARAEAAVEQLLQQQPGIPVVVQDETVGGQVIHRVLAGRFSDRFEATLVSDKLKAIGVSASVGEMVLEEG